MFCCLPCFCCYRAVGGTTETPLCLSQSVRDHASYRSPRVDPTSGCLRSVSSCLFAVSSTLQLRDDFAGVASLETLAQRPNPLFGSLSRSGVVTRRFLVGCLHEHYRCSERQYVFHTATYSQFLTALFAHFTELKHPTVSTLSDMSGNPCFGPTRVNQK